MKKLLVVGAVLDHRSVLSLEVLDIGNLIRRNPNEFIFKLKMCPILKV